MSGKQRGGNPVPTPALSSARAPRALAPHVVSREGPVVALLCRAGITLAAVHALSQAFDRATEDPRRRIGLLVVLAPDIDVRLPTGVREAMARLVNQHQHAIAATAVAFEGRGFKATIVRSVVTAIAIMSSIRFPYKVEDGAERGIAWLVAQLGPDVATATERQLYALIQGWRSVHPSIPPR